MPEPMTAEKPTTYPEMNARIADILRLSIEPANHYAAQLIEELQAERDQYKAALEEISQAVAEQANEPELDKLEWLAKCLNRLSRIGIIARKAIKGTDGLPTTAELSGSDPDFTGGMESVQYVRMLRGDDEPTD